MIKASDSLIQYIESQKSIVDFANQLGVSRQTVYNIKRRHKVSSNLVAKLLQVTGFTYEKAFETRN